jgi:hypothetical protein
MNTQKQRKQIFMLALAIMLVIGSYWIPLSPHAPMRNRELPTMVAQSAPVESGIFARSLVQAWPFW